MKQVRTYVALDCNKDPIRTITLCYPLEFISLSKLLSASSNNNALPLPARGEHPASRMTESSLNWSIRSGDGEAFLLDGGVEGGIR